MVIKLCFSLTAPAAQVDASSRVTVVYKGKTKSFGNKKTYAYVNNEKIKAVKQPIFIKNGSYMGPVNKLFKKSSLKVKVTSSENTLTLQYRSKCRCSEERKPQCDDKWRGFQNVSSGDAGDISERKDKMGRSVKTVSAAVWASPIS